MTELNIGTALGFKGGPKPGSVGIEIEVERPDENIVATARKYGWAVDRDGSLRDNGIELISPPLQPAQAAEEAASLVRAASKCSFSERTSIHVHADVRGFSPQQLADLLVASAMFEPAMAGITGVERQRNIFSLGLQYSTDQLSRWSSLVSNLTKVVDVVGEEEKVARHMFQDAILSRANGNQRYAYVNLASLPNHGTLEFRGMPGTHDADRVATWILFISELRTFSTEQPYQDIMQAINDCSGDFLGLCTAAFSEQVLDLLDTSEQAGIDGARLAQDVLTYRPKAKCKKEVRNPDAIVQVAEAAAKNAEPVKRAAKWRSSAPVELFFDEAIQAVRGGQ